MNFLAFDLGGSSGKLFLGTVSGNQLKLAELHKFENQPVSMGNGLYWDFIHIYNELCTGIKKAVAITDDTITSLGFDSFCNDFGLIDEKGNLITPVRCYRDARTLRCQTHTYGILSPEELYQINGNQNAPFNTLLHLDAMHCEGEDWLLNNCYKALFVSDLFTWLLTGKAVTEYTTASVTQMFDYKTSDWSEEILRRYHIRKSLFAPLVMPGKVIGETTPHINAQLHTCGFPVTAVCQHDTASAFLASVCDEDCAIISCGTWCLVGTEVDAPIIGHTGFIENIANEGGYPGHHRLLRNVMGTWIIQEILRELNQLTPEQILCLLPASTVFSTDAAGSQPSFTYAMLDELARQIVFPNCFIDVDDTRFYQPGTMIEKVIAFCQEQGQQPPQSIGALISCVYVSLAFKYRYTIEKLQQVTGHALPVINMLGGGSNSTLMCQITATICQRVVVAGPADATALGNLLVQMLSCQVLSSVSEGRAMIRRSFPCKTYEPEVSKHAQQAYQTFLQTEF